MSFKLFGRTERGLNSDIKVFFSVSVILGVIAAVARSVAYITSFDSEIGYFNGTVFPTAVNWLLVLSCVFAACAFWRMPKSAGLPCKLSSSSNSVFFSSCFAGFILVADLVYKILAIFGENRLEYYGKVFSRTFRSENAYFLRATALIEIIAVLASALSAVYFFLGASKKAGTRMAVCFGFFPVLRALCGVASIYFEMEVQMNHPSKLILQFALIAIMLCLLSEMRFGISEDHPRPRRYFISACVAFILSFSAGASEMFGFFSGNLTDGDFCVEAFFCFTVSLYILARLNSFVKLLGTAREPEAESVPEEAEQTEVSE